MPIEVELNMFAATELIILTNSQFKFWADAIKAASKCEIPGGNNMNLWFIMSRLALQREHEFAMSKADLYSAIPSLGPEAVRKHISVAQKCGFLESFRGDGPLSVRLTPVGKGLVTAALNNWASKFGAIQDKYFR